MAGKTVALALFLGAADAFAPATRTAAPLRTKTVVFEDFGLLSGTKLGFDTEWAAKADDEPCLSELTMRDYMQDKGLRYKLSKYGYKKFVGDWFYADQLSTDESPESSGGFNMQKGGYFPDGKYRKGTDGKL